MTTNIIDHVSITVDDIERARLFYDAVMTALGVRKVYDTAEALGYGQRCEGNDHDRSYFSVLLSTSTTPFVDPRRHWCFKAASRQAVDEAFAAALDHHGSGLGGPGLRAEYHASYYAAFVSDPCGNKLEFVCHSL